MTDQELKGIAEKLRSLADQLAPEQGFKPAPPQRQNGELSQFATELRGTASRIEKYRLHRSGGNWQGG